MGDINKLAGPLVTPRGLTHHLEKSPILVKHVALGFCDDAKRLSGDCATIAMYRRLIKEGLKEGVMFVSRQPARYDGSYGEQLADNIAFFGLGFNHCYRGALNLR